MKKFGNLGGALKFFRFSTFFSFFYNFPMKTCEILGGALKNFRFFGGALKIF